MAQARLIRKRGDVSDYVRDIEFAASLTAGTKADD